MTEVIALIGPDGTGKSKICSIIRTTFDIEIVDLPNFTYSTSALFRLAGKIFKSVSDIGDKRESRLFSAIFAYAPAVALATYADKRAQEISPHAYLFSRHPKYDIPVHLDLYVPEKHKLHGIGEKTAMAFTKRLSHPTSVIYLQATSNQIMDRIKNQNRPFQSHENVKDLDRIIESYERVIQEIPDSCLRIIDTTTNPLEMVCQEVITYVGAILR